MDKRLEQALRTLRAIRQRYETESDAGSARRRSYTIQIALGYADMRWIAAAIEELEKATPGIPSVDSSAHPAVSASQPPPPAQPSSHTSNSSAAVDFPSVNEEPTALTTGAAQSAIDSGVALHADDRAGRI